MPNQRQAVVDKNALSLESNPLDSVSTESRNPYVHNKGAKQADLSNQKAIEAMVNITQPHVDAAVTREQQDNYNEARYNTDAQDIHAASPNIFESVFGPSATSKGYADAQANKLALDQHNVRMNTLAVDVDKYSPDEYMELLELERRETMKGMSGTQKNAYLEQSTNMVRTATTTHSAEHNKNLQTKSNQLWKDSVKSSITANKLDILNTSEETVDYVNPLLDLINQDGISDNAKSNMLADLIMEEAVSGTKTIYDTLEANGLLDMVSSDNMAQAQKSLDVLQNNTDVSVLHLKQQMQVTSDAGNLDATQALLDKYMLLAPVEATKIYNDTLLRTSKQALRLEKEAKNKREADLLRRTSRKVDDSGEDLLNTDLHLAARIYRSERSEEYTGSTADLQALIVGSPDTINSLLLQYPNAKLPELRGVVSKFNQLSNMDLSTASPDMLMELEDTALALTAINKAHPNALKKNVGSVDSYTRMGLFNDLIDVGFSVPQASETLKEYSNTRTSIPKITNKERTDVGDNLGDLTEFSGTPGEQELYRNTYLSLRENYTPEQAHKLTEKHMSYDSLEINGVNRPAMKTAQDKLQAVVPDGTLEGFIDNFTRTSVGKQAFSGFTSRYFSAGGAWDKNVFVTESDGVLTFIDTNTLATVDIRLPSNVEEYSFKREGSTLALYENDPTALPIRQLDTTHATPYEYQNLTGKDIYSTSLLSL